MSVNENRTVPLPTLPCVCFVQMSEWKIKLSADIHVLKIQYKDDS